MSDDTTNEYANQKCTWTDPIYSFKKLRAHFCLVCCLTDPNPAKIIRGYLHRIFLLQIYYKNWNVGSSFSKLLTLAMCFTKIHSSNFLVFRVFLNKVSVVQLAYNYDFKVQSCCRHSEIVAGLGLALPCKNTFLKFPFTGTQAEA